MEVGRAAYRQLLADDVPKTLAAMREAKKRYDGGLLRATRTLPYFLSALDRYEKKKGLDPSR